MSKSKREIIMEQIAQVKSIRPKRVLEHILKNGQVTTEELASHFDYAHPPRAARDVREQGIPLKTVRVPSQLGKKKIAAYQIDFEADVVEGKLGGRKIFSKKFKEDLVEMYGESCAVCSEKYPARYLQIDHRLPYEMGGETLEPEKHPEKFMLLCGTCNRQKSWSCESCENWTKIKNPDFCKQCFWGNPESFSHVALRPIRRLEISWSDDQVALFDELQREAKSRNLSMQEFVKESLATYVLKKKM